jgi:hypothetical protein
VHSDPFAVAARDVCGSHFETWEGNGSRCASLTLFDATLALRFS